MVQPKYGRRLSLGGKEKISPSLGRKARVKVNLGKRPRRETGVPGGKPKARLSLGVSLEEVVLSLGKEPKVSQGHGRGLRVDLNLEKNPRKRLNLGVKEKITPGLGRKARVSASPGGKPRKRLSPGGKEKISPGRLGRKALVRINLGKRPRRETDVPGGKPKVRLNLGANPGVILNLGKEPKATQGLGRGLKVDLNPARKPVESLGRGRNRREILSLGARAVSVCEDPGLIPRLRSGQPRANEVSQMGAVAPRAGKNRVKVKHRVIIPALSTPY